MNTITKDNLQKASSEGNFLVKKVCRFEKTLPIQKFPAISEISYRLAKLGQLAGRGWQAEMVGKSGFKKSAISKKKSATFKKVCRFGL